MGAIQIISASAGSGKTWRLAKVLEDSLVAGNVRPEAVLATTYTKKAAAELRERVRQRLLGHGRPEDAQRLSAARMGTVHSICSQLINQFAFEAGVSPSLAVLDEATARRSLGRVIDNVTNDVETKDLADLELRLEGFDWHKTVDEMINLARHNCMATPKQLRESSRRSLAGLAELQENVEADGGTVDRALIAALESFLGGVEEDGQKNTAGAVQKAHDALSTLRSGRKLHWRTWVTLTKLNPGARWRPLAAPVIEAAGAFDRHPDLWADMRRAIELCFDVAARALGAYQEHKRHLGVVDFVDQETLALELLGHPAVRGYLSQEIDLVLVDEFQDTNPIQLAIFLKLSELAKQCVWVGDQKQAIFGFQGTDPQLMDAVIDHVLGSGEPESLSHSYRSRPDLVSVTSELFARAFGEHGIPEARVRLSAKREEPAETIGSQLEIWDTRAKNQRLRANSLALHIKDLLDDENAQVFDKQQQTVRPSRPGDVGVLCRTHKSAAAVAGELRDLGIRSVVSVAGLLSTAEVRVVVAGLKLWLDGRDRLAAVELSRFLTDEADPDTWLEGLVAGEQQDDLGLAAVSALRSASAGEQGLGVLGVLERVLELTGIRERCLAWGDADARLANLEALRCHVQQYLDLAATAARPATMLGLMAHLQQLAEAAEDSRPVLHDDGAVQISTWHSAKGLEWPVTILFNLEESVREFPSIGVHVVSDRKTVDLADPLGGRWIRYWLDPFHGGQKKTPFHDRLRLHRVNEEALERAKREALRLLYVGWTRARDRLVLAAAPTQLGEGILELLSSGGEPLLEPPDGSGKFRWAEMEVEIGRREPAPAAPAEASTEGDEGYVPAGPRAYPRAFLRASDLEAKGRTGEPIKIGERLTIAGSPDMRCLGEAVHGFLAADRAEREEGKRREIALGLLRRWGVEVVLDADELMRASDALRGWIQDRWPEARWRRELPLTGRQEGGTVVSGISDLVLETTAGPIVIDHKSFPGSVEQAVKKAGGFAGQLTAYADILTSSGAGGRAECFIHLPISGLIIPVQKAS